MNIERISFDIISEAGQARNLIYEALEYIRDQQYKEAENKIKIAEKLMLKAHESHAFLVSEQAKGNEIKVDLLLSHAMDILMIVESERDITKKIMEIDFERVKNF
ncbi:PTS lactose/cellobiose transporter subunit IIA [Garciella nitratireducens]|uniref:PTS system, cellobiose-specific IIA component n=1 Tax=Garciella nitratireducens DSM 15102 TaxID=1121911 RepID=A0A1T4LGU7_9FIRM|nr:PTS lactose/cellobiose transporter subunit IIA [Garciella nitratireducens]RBP46797.1 PTS system cellobiose-specific IIA component [Garciella nitratireducens]SJZ53801.1 PTS system, cellobiose-specific IIA component [Garciella nitratireducens DSM 15102]